MAFRQENESLLHHRKLVSLLVCAVFVVGCRSGAVTSPDQENQSASSILGSPSGADPDDGEKPRRSGDPRSSKQPRSKGPRGDDEPRDDPDSRKSPPADRPPDGPGGDKEPPDDDPGDDKPTYSWVLPPGDTSPRGNEGGGYGILLRCQGAKGWITGAWEGFNSPRNVLMYMAAAHLCDGDNAGGRRLYNRVVSHYGLAGLDQDANACDVFRSVASVLLQGQRERFSCQGGHPPQWRHGQAGPDNPLTFDVDESRPPTTT
jgi:hypothetical protein